MRDYQKEFKGHCLTCEQYDISSKKDSTQRGYRCKHHHRPMAMDECCSSYRFDAIRSNKMIEEAVSFRVRKGYNPGPDKGHWYVTTAICYVLGLDIECEYLENFRMLRDGYMRQIEEGRQYLLGYDLFGPLISYKIIEAYNDPKRRTGIIRMCKEVLEPDFLVVMNQMIKAGEFECAMLAYMQMVDMLAQRYNVYMEPVIYDPESVDAQEIASGRKRICSMC